MAGFLIAAGVSQTGTDAQNAGGDAANESSLRLER